MTAACRYSKWSVKPSRWFVYDSMCLRCFNYNSSLPFPNWNMAHHSPNSYVAHGLVYQHLLHHSPAVLMYFAHFLLTRVPIFHAAVTPVPLGDEVQRQWVIIQKMRSGFDQKLPQTSSILNPASGASVALWTQNLGIPMA